MRHFAITAFVGILTATCCLTASGADKLIVVQGNNRQTSLKGTILRDDIKGVSIRVTMGGGKAKMDFSRKQIVKTTYGVLAGNFETGKTHFDAEGYENALNRFHMAEETRDVKRNAWALQYVNRMLALTYQAIGDKASLKKSIVYWNKLVAPISGSKKSRFVADGVAGTIETYAALGLWDKAASAVSKLKAMGSSFESMASFYRARIAELKKDYSKAAGLYKTLATSIKDSELKAKAWGGCAKCAVDGKNWTLALKASKKILAIKDAPDQVMAIAYQVKGEASLRSIAKIETKVLANDEKKVGMVLDGMLDMLRPAYQFGATSKWAEPRGLYRSAKWCEKLHIAGKLGNWDKRALALYRDIVYKFGKTKWGKAAVKRIEALKG
jgi:tetratricopeptide (TPR) repeat protein